MKTLPHVAENIIENFLKNVTFEVIFLLVEASIGSL